MIEFQLFRIKVFPLDLFRNQQGSSDILKQIINSHPFASSSKGLVWHIGNVTPIDQNGVYFRIGRTSNSTVALYKEQESVFVDQEFEFAPYTHVVLYTAPQKLDQGLR